MMKRAMVLVILLVALTATANANVIGMFADLEGTQCSADFPLYATTPVHVVVLLSDLPAITAAEFRIEGPAIDAAAVIVSQAWNSQLTIGSVFGDGFSIAFPEPQPGPIVPLGIINFFVIGEWPGPNAFWCIVPTLDSGLLALVDDNYDTHDAYGWCFVGNCIPGGPYGDCTCDSPVATEDSSWGTIKAMY